MAGISYANDPLSRALMRGLLLLQPAALSAVLILALLDLSLPALAISMLTLFIFVAIVVWLYLRYRKLPVVREKRMTQHLVEKFRRRLQAEAMITQAALHERDRLVQAEEEQVQAALSVLQQDHIARGLASASLAGASIPGVGPELQQRLAAQGILTAAAVTASLSQHLSLGEAESRALEEWRSTVLARLESTQPSSLPDEALETIQSEFWALHEQNDVVERRAIDSQKILEHELMLLEPRLRQLAPFTFLGYLSRSIASRSIVAALIAFVLIAAQVLSSVSAMGAALIASLP